MRIEASSGIQFANVLLNYYRDGQDSVAGQRDKENEFDANPIIIPVSFIETRPFDILRVSRKDIEKIFIPPNHDSFLQRGAPMQHFWGIRC